MSTSPDDVVLHFRIQLDKIGGKPADANYQITVLLRIGKGVLKRLVAVQIELQLLNPLFDEDMGECGETPNPFCSGEQFRAEAHVDYNATGPSVIWSGYRVDERGRTVDVVTEKRRSCV